MNEVWLHEDGDTSQVQVEGYNSIPQRKSCGPKRYLIIDLHEHF